MPALTIGLTGGIASGKSLVQTEFEALGVPVLDADLVARTVVAPGTPAIAQIAAEFGSEMLLPDGSLDRRRMRERVFTEPDARRRLETITHPAIRAEMGRWREAQTAPYCLISVAILLEARMQDLVDRILVIDVPPSMQLQRLQHRDGIDEALARGMLAAQASREQRLAVADDVLRNDGSPEQTRAAVARLHAFYRDCAARGTPRAPGLRLPDPVI